MFWDQSRHKLCVSNYKIVYACIFFWFLEKWHIVAQPRRLYIPPISFECDNEIFSKKYVFVYLRF